MKKFKLLYLENIRSDSIQAHFLININSNKYLFYFYEDTDRKRIAERILSSEQVVRAKSDNVYLEILSSIDYFVKTDRSTNFNWLSSENIPNKAIQLFNTKIKKYCEKHLINS